MLDKQKQQLVENGRFGSPGTYEVLRSDAVTSFRTSWGVWVR
ncbi:hypothetical protein F4560_000911 [Saccharothrix ecbatanensis]|uniref:Uncharacterized protein n=1 Tax=Saccharothrix ecbatanensis TaxID=1105145 RepID=A0A7W9HFR9_9PSEU|nr:hypothetical protein [Saccharothrix ecbatanensis]